MDKLYNQNQEYTNDQSSNQWSKAMFGEYYEEKRKEKDFSSSKALQPTIFRPGYSNLGGSSKQAKETNIKKETNVKKELQQLIRRKDQEYWQNWQQEQKEKKEQEEQQKEEQQKEEQQKEEQQKEEQQ